MVDLKGRFNRQGADRKVPMGLREKLNSDAF